MENNLFCRILKDAQNTGTAVASINILNHATTRAVVAAASRAYRPVIIQPSTGTVKRYGVQELKKMVESVRAYATVPVALHLDHCRDEDLARACILAGWDSVMVDYSALPFAENVAKTRRTADFAHLHGVAVEGEIGVISGVEEDVSADHNRLASLEETVSYIEKSGVDAVAPAIGTAHGVYTGRPVLNFDLVQQLGYRYVPVVVHGGTGLTDEEFCKLIACGAAKINISTALKQVYLGTSRTMLMDEKIAPVPFDQAVEEACSASMERFIRLFAGEKP